MGGGQGAGGSLSLSFQRQDKQGNESVIISRNCLPLPGLCARPHSLAGYGQIKDGHCPNKRQSRSLQSTTVHVNDTSRGEWGVFLRPCRLFKTSLTFNEGKLRFCAVIAVIRYS